MSAKSDLPQDTRDLGQRSVSCETATLDGAAGLEVWNEAPDAPPTRRERRIDAVVKFCLQGVYILALTFVAVVPMMFVPSCSRVAWTLVKTILIMDAGAYLLLMSALLLIVDRRLRPASDGA